MVYVPEAKTWLTEAEEARGRYVTSQARFNQLVDAGDKWPHLPSCTARPCRSW